MRGLWRLLFCIAAFALVAQITAQEDEGDEPEAEEPEGEEPEGEEGGEEEPEEGDPAEEGEEGDPGPELEPEKLKMLHMKIDGNHDGKISLEEIIAYSKSHRHASAHKDAKEHMEMMDENKDGKVSQGEAVQDPEAQEPDEEADEHERARQKKMQQQWHELEIAKFKAGDKNGDGFLDDKELPAVVFPEISDEILDLMVAHTLKTKDKNGDGELDNKEFWETPDGEELSEDDIIEFRRVDTDGNGKLNQKEIRSWESGEYHTRHAMDQFIQEADADKDGHISTVELDEHIGKLAGTDAGATFTEWTSDEL